MQRLFICAACALSAGLIDLIHHQKQNAHIICKETTKASLFLERCFLFTIISQGASHSRFTGSAGTIGLHVNSGHGGFF